MNSRFYDLKSGELNIEGKDIKQLNLPFVRTSLGIVSQVNDDVIANTIMYIVHFKICFLRMNLFTTLGFMILSELTRSIILGIKI